MKSIEKSDLEGIGFRGLHARQLLSVCTPRLVTVSLGEYGNPLGTVQIARYMKVADVREMIGRERPTSVPGTFQFVLGQSRLRLSVGQEQSWEAETIVSNDQLLLQESSCEFRSKLPSFHPLKRLTNLSVFQIRQALHSQQSQVIGQTYRI